MVALGDRPAYRGAMATVLVLHSALGLRPAVHDLVEHLRSGGHTVEAPDLLDGATFDGGEEGYAAALAHVRADRPAIETRAREAWAAQSGPVVLAGMSFGAVLAQDLAVEHVGDGSVLGLLLIGGGGIDAGEGVWRKGAPLALHHSIDDPWVDAEPLDGLVRLVTGAGSDVSDYVYPGSGHLFFDDGLPGEYDPESADLLRVRALGFLSRF